MDWLLWLISSVVLAAGGFTAGYLFGYAGSDRRR